MGDVVWCGNGFVDLGIGSDWCVLVVGFRVVVCFAVHLVSSGLAFAMVLV